MSRSRPAAATPPALLLLSALALAACSGGGGGGGEPVTPPVPAPVIVTQPASRTVPEGQAAGFAVVATGSGLAYQWQRDGADLAGATSAAYVLPEVTLADDGAVFRVVVSNAGGAVTSDAATLRVTAAAPVITAHPAPQVVDVGAPATFSVTATGNGLAYQWRRGTADIPGATSSVYVLPAAALEDDGATFRVTVSNAGGAVTSEPAALTVSPLVIPVRAEPSVAATANGGVALKANGTVWAWGGNSVGELGQGTTASTSAPVQVRGPGGVGVLSGVVQLSAGPEHVLALRNDGTVWIWGRTAALGATTAHEDPIISLLPIQVRGVDGVGFLERVVGVSAGDRVSAAVLDDGTVAAWGDNGRGGVGIGTAGPGGFTPAAVEFPTPVPGVTGVVEVSAGYHRVLARRADGAILSWGSNPNGELGRAGPDTATPGLVDGIGSAVRAVAGRDRSLAILADGSARMWGLHGFDGTAGTGTGAACDAAASSAPVAIPRPHGVASSFAMLAPVAPGASFIHGGELHYTGRRLADLAAELCTRGLEPEEGPGALAGVARGWSWHTFAWDAAGSVFGLGVNANGELGVGDTADVPGLRELPGFSLYGDEAAGTTVFFADFETPAPAALVAGADAGAASVEGFAGLGPAAEPFGGSFLRSATGNVVTLTLADLPPHGAISLGFLFAAIDSLDGAGTFPGGDYFRITLDGETIFREAFANATASQVQTYLPPPGVELARRVDLGFVGPGGFYTDSAYDLGADPRFRRVPHTGTTATFTFQIEGEGIQSLGDESWGMDNLRVTVER